MTFSAFNSSSAEECLEGNCINGFGKKKIKSSDYLVWESIGIYEGEFKDGKFHGKGTFVPDIEHAIIKDYVTILKVEYVMNEGVVAKAIYYQKDGFIFENIHDNNGALISGTFYFADDRLMGNFKDGMPYGKVIITSLKAGQFSPYIQEGTMIICEDGAPQLDGKITDTYRDGKKYENIYECGALIKGTSFSADGYKLEGTFTVERYNGLKKWSLYDGIQTDLDGKQVEYKNGKAMTFTVTKEILNPSDVEKQRSKALEAYNKALKCYFASQTAYQFKDYMQMIDGFKDRNDYENLLYHSEEFLSHPAYSRECDSISSK